MKGPNENLRKTHYSLERWLGLMTMLFALYMITKTLDTNEWNLVMAFMMIYWTAMALVDALGQIAVVRNQLEGVQQQLNEALEKQERKDWEGG